MPIVTRDTLQQMLDQAQTHEARARIVGRALVALFARQTAGEQAANTTDNWNTVGFSGADGRSGSLTAKSFLKHGTLLDWQVDRWTKKGVNGYSRLCKYHRQLNEIAEVKAAQAVQLKEAA